MIVEAAYRKHKVLIMISLNPASENKKKPLPQNLWVLFRAIWPRKRLMQQGFVSHGTSKTMFHFGIQFGNPLGIGIGAVNPGGFGGWPPCNRT
jgi:hypothetical protein